MTKVKLQNVPEERIVRIGSGTEEVCLSTGGIIYKIIGTITSIGSKFNHYKDEEAGVSWKDTTLESAALAGLSFNPQPFINSMLSGNEVVAAKAQKGAVAAMKSALSNGEMRAGSAVASGIAWQAVQTTGFTRQTDNNVSLVKNMFILEFSYRFSSGKKVKKEQKNIDQESEGGSGGLL